MNQLPVHIDVRLLEAIDHVMAAVRAGADPNVSVTQLVSVPHKRAWPTVVLSQSPLCLAIRAFPVNPNLVQELIQAGASLSPSPIQPSSLLNLTMNTYWQALRALMNTPSATPKNAQTLTHATIDLLTMLHQQKCRWDGKSRSVALHAKVEKVIQTLLKDLKSSKYPKWSMLEPMMVWLADHDVSLEALAKQAARSIGRRRQVQLVLGTRNVIEDLAPCFQALIDKQQMRASLGVTNQKPSRPSKIM